jgi:hypothetical protein
MSRIPIENNIHLKRDEYTNAIINTNMFEYNEYIKNKSKREREEKRISSLENQITELKSDISDIKKLIMGLYK